MAFTDATPKQAEPMQAVGRETSTIIASQPTAEPAPMAQLDAENDAASMRGGGTTCGFNCCHGHCSFYKSCC